MIFRVADRQCLANPEKVPPLHHRPTPLFLRLRLLRLAQAAIELQHLGDVLRNLVAEPSQQTMMLRMGTRRGMGDATLASIAQFLEIC